MASFSADGGVRVLVIGGGGMMGHMACRVLGRRHEVFATVRQTYRSEAPLAQFLSADRWLGGIDIHHMEAVEAAVAKVRPEVVFNCVGIVKQLDEAKNAVLSIEVNSLLPHRLALIARDAGARLVHLSTDCVFSGRRGMYTEDDLPDPVDLYGRSKLLGETGPHEGLTLRTSIVGRQLTGHTSLFEWVLSSRGGRVSGFDRAVYTGLTTMALAEIVDRVIVDHADLSGVWQVASAPITKYELIRMLDDRLSLGLTIDRDTEFFCDRSLDGTAFATRTGIAVPSWDEMIDQFAADQDAYATLDGTRA